MILVVESTVAVRVIPVYDTLLHMTPVALKEIQTDRERQTGGGRVISHDTCSRTHSRSERERERVIPVYDTLLHMTPVALKERQTDRGGVISPDTSLRMSPVVVSGRGLGLFFLLSTSPCPL